MAESWLSFKLDDSFVKGYEGIDPNFGFGGLGELVFYRTYSRIKDNGEKESFSEVIRRCVEGAYSLQKDHISDHKLGWDEKKAQDSAQIMYDHMFNMRFLPPGRGLWMMGTEYAHTKTPMGMFNCSFISTQNVVNELAFPFQFLMDVSMLGVGCGFDTKGAGQLTIHKPGPDALTYIIPDSREGWVESLGKLINSYLVEGSSQINFDYSEIRLAGSSIKGFGGVSSGPGPLIKLHDNIRVIMDQKAGTADSTMDSRVIVDIMNLVGECVVAGNVRRCIPKGTLVHTKEGLVPIEKILPGMKAITSKGHYPISELIPQGKQLTVLIKTQLGDLECTRNHKVAVLDSPYKYSWKNAGDLTPGDRLVFLDHISQGKETNLPSWKYEKVPHSTTCKDITIPDLDAEMAWFFGVFHGDGYVYPNFSKKGFNAYVGVACPPDNEGLKDRVSGALSRFGTNITVYDPKYNGCFSVRSQSKQLAWYLSQFKEANKSINIPDFILRGTEEIRAAYIAGLLDADGCPTNRPIILASSIYPDYLKQVQSVYASLGIPTRLKLARTASGNWKALSTLSLTGREAVATFQEKVSPFSSRYVDGPLKRQSPHDYGYPSDMVLSLGINSKRYWDRSSKKMTVSTLKRCGKDPEGLIPVEVFGVENGNYVDTYDISVPTVHEFKVGPGLLVHNSAEIAIGDPQDTDFLNLKNYELNPERKNFGRYSNNTVDVKLGQSYTRLADRTITNGEPGYIWLENCRKFGRMIDPPNWKDAGVSGTNPCFAGDQRLLVVEDGQEIYRTFEELNGTVVTIFNPVTRGTTSGVRIFDTGMREILDLCLSNGKKIRCTPDHRFMSNTGKEVEAKDLKGLRLLSGFPSTNEDDRENNFPEVLNIVRAGVIEKVYDFSMPNTHWGVVEGVVAHNCGEISLESGETCNLVEIFMPNIANKREFFNVIKYAYLYAKSVTLVKTHLEVNNRVQMRNRRIGLSLSGIAMFKEKEGVTKMVDWMDDGYLKVQHYDEIYSKWLAIPKSIKTTTVKPSGSVSLVAGTSSGIHYPMNSFYLKNMRIGNNSEVMDWARECGYKIEAEIKYEEDESGDWVPTVSDSTSVISIPVKFPFEIRARSQVSIWEQMKLVELVQKYWADNQVSVTVTFNEGEEDEVSRVLSMFDRDLKTASFLKNFSADYPQMPEQEVDELYFEEYTSSITTSPILDYMKEDAAGVKYCSGDTCELDFVGPQESEVSTEE